MLDDGLRQRRNRVLRGHDMNRQAGFPRRPVARPGHEADLKKRTLTNLYNARPTWLALVHQELDAAEAAGLRTVQLVRGDRDPASHHPQVQRFDDIHPEQIPA